MVSTSIVQSDKDAIATILNKYSEIIDNCTTLLYGKVLQGIIWFQNQKNFYQYIKIHGKSNGKFKYNHPNGKRRTVSDLKGKGYYAVRINGYKG